MAQRTFKRLIISFFQGPSTLLTRAEKKIGGKRRERLGTPNCYGLIGNFKLKKRDLIELLCFSSRLVFQSISVMGEIGY
jgi:hypothetical protein